MTVIAEIPAQNRVSDIVRSPVGEKEIKPPKIVEIVFPGFPNLIKIIHGSVVKIPDVIHNEFVALNLPVRNLFDIKSPVFIMGRCQGLPPDEQSCKNYQAG